MVKVYAGCKRDFYTDAMQWDDFERNIPAAFILPSSNRVLRLCSIILGDYGYVDILN